MAMTVANAGGVDVDTRRAPFGGAGPSGIGREGGDWSFDFYAGLKNTVYAPQG
jgi:acyl-CoA reductase-like NAD-dependent aldehyde dehydrogenase